MEIRMNNTVPNFLRVSGQRATFDYRGVRKVCRRCGMDFKDQCATPRCERCVVFGYATEGCVRNCSRCGGTYATADCTARQSYSMVTAGGFSAAFPPLQEPRENGDGDRSRLNERLMEVNEDEEIATPETTDDTRSEETQSHNTQVAHSNWKETEDNKETQRQTAKTADAMIARSEDGSKAPAGAEGCHDGGREEDGRHDGSSRALPGVGRSQGSGRGEDGRHDGDGDGRRGGDSIEQRQRSRHAARGRGKLSLRCDDVDNEAGNHFCLRPGEPGTQQNVDGRDPTGGRKVAAHVALQTAAQDDG
ncbi:hypothetical protein HPB48_007179 [Haemaphysalis longicornis]|uniref:Uncharacterized protein n=1 Tax=Haemaphysalis longicornis TaxID=44386 RepID=A0A9J6G3T4_HAELO|nr:hypothetical protein HPB48_007179 [Haemaphysalis longicornis]